MATKLRTRVKNIISGSLHSLLDYMETANPMMVLEQATREINEAIQDIRDELGRIAAAKHMSSQRLHEISAEYDRLQEHCLTAVDSQRDDLAKTAIAKQLDLETQMPILKNTIADYQEQIVELEDYLSALQAKHRECVAEKQKLVAIQNSASGDNSVNGAATSTVAKRVANATETFERIMQQQYGLHSNVLQDAEHTQQLQELELLTRSKKIEERLLALKS